MIASCADLDTVARIRLILELDLEGWLEADSLDENGLLALPELVAAGITPDDARAYRQLASHPFSERETYLARSPAVATYVCELDLSSQDIAQIVRSPRVRPDTKLALAGNATFLQGRLDKTSAVALAEWARNGQELGVDALVVLSEAGAPAEAILDLLGTHLQDIAQDDLDRILAALGEMYEPLTRTGRHRPRLSDRPGTTELLDELKRRGRVSSHSKGLLSSKIQVNMRQ